RASRLATWMPRAVVTTRRTGRRRARSLVACDDVRRPRAFSGLGVVTVLTIDMDRGLPWVDSDAVMSDAQTIYGSPGSLYVATQRWIDPDTPADALPAGAATEIHRFAAAERAETAYRASGRVSGHLLNQFSLSEHRGDLRVATTETPVWMGGEEIPSESAVTVLREAGGRLQAVGAVRGMGRGERIYSVRFIEDVGFVVTFRQTDPLYALDLTDPVAPRVAGELKIPGYSAYLHPLGDGLLLGVGQDATDDGRVTGTQLSLFDVSDLARPVRLHQRTIAPSSSSQAEYDHHAFLYWAPSRLAVLPVDVFGDDGGVFSGALGFSIDRAAGIAEAGRISHPPADGVAPPVLRAAVVGERLFTLSDAGLLASALAGLAPQAWLPLPPR
ncbi:MAG TPA: beta-propeller domain-containing protein, partial [Solirubrobacteraceae bacterium]|nr:beta-propeller domain-containing protein [Solirubrobacteraceae bacterium]